MKRITYMGRPTLVACDGQCHKAWGIAARPRIQFDDGDDNALLADGELGNAPKDPGVSEGGHLKPVGPDDMNRWCTRQCERSVLVEPGEAINLPDLSRRVFNQPWKHVND